MLRSLWLATGASGRLTITAAVHQRTGGGVRTPRVRRRFNAGADRSARVASSSPRLGYHVMPKRDSNTVCEGSEKEILQTFLHGRSHPCPVCGYDLRDLCT